MKVTKKQFEEAVRTIAVACVETWAEDCNDCLMHPVCFGDEVPCTLDIPESEDNSKNEQ